MIQRTEERDRRPKIQRGKRDGKKHWRNNTSRGDIEGREKGEKKGDKEDIDSGERHRSIDRGKETQRKRQKLKIEGRDRGEK
jgi:hypothetical protein